MLRTILLSLVSLSLVPFVTAFRPVTSGNITVCERGSTSGKSIILSLYAEKGTDCECNVRVVKPVSMNDEEYINFQILNPSHNLCGHRVRIASHAPRYVQYLNCLHTTRGQLRVTDTRWIKVGFDHLPTIMNNNRNCSEKDLEISLTDLNSKSHLEIQCQGLPPDLLPNKCDPRYLLSTSAANTTSLPLTQYPENYWMSNTTELNYVPHVVCGVLSGISVIVPAAVIIFCLIKRKRTIIYDQPSTILPTDHHPYSSIDKPEPIYSTISDYHYAYTITPGTTYIPQTKTPPIPRRQISNSDSGVVGDIEEVRDSDTTLKIKL